MFFCKWYHDYHIIYITNKYLANLYSWWKNTYINYMWYIENLLKT